MDSALERAAAGDTAGAVAAVLEALDAGASQEQLASLASDADVLAALDDESAGEVFSAVDPEALDGEQKEAMATALTGARMSIKRTFEDKIDVYGGGFDTYVPVGSRVPVAKRRTLIAAAAATTGAIAAGSAGVTRGGSGTGGAGGGRGDSGGRGDGGDGGGRGDGGRGDGGRGDGGDSPRREGSGDYDPDQAIGLGPSSAAIEEAALRSVARRQARRFFKRNSVSQAAATAAALERRNNTKEHVLMKIVRIILRELGPMAFTMAGAVIVLATLSGHTQKIAMVATSAAAVLHFTNAVNNALREERAAELARDSGSRSEDRGSRS